MIQRKSYRIRRRSGNKCIAKLRSHSKEYNKDSSLAEQSLLHLCQKEQQKWEMNQFSSARLLIQLMYTFDMLNKKKNRPPRP
jgi:hypothetical protein